MCGDWGRPAEAVDAVSWPGCWLRKCTQLVEIYRDTLATCTLFLNKNEFKKLGAGGGALILKVLCEPGVAKGSLWIPWFYFPAFTLWD